ncbi:VID27 cytoplasmic protein-domain-containing protein [Dimargaris cristalligena]|uniref:VID27 cytoplasmic protein-domain-containing protein n=1 Tax=Dimargaris cristalligena TaxID=215637 RepID=A0A4P9ZZU7_9FUNG|nr:VID27 cytoplasmic protein-domain-containing protein [Dimargaris cristalligena]|eukprot:RKP39263.1 VID27 cytoplasmic protein-domain-containing protein [Dimargaris cristalligena]
MFNFQALRQAIWGDSDNVEKLVIPAGRFYLTRPRHLAQGPQECLFNDARLAVCRTSTPYQYQLVVSRVYDEGEVELNRADASSQPGTDNDDNNGPEDEFAWLIAPDLGLHMVTVDHLPALKWVDPKGDPEEAFLFELDVGGTRARNCALAEDLERVLQQCLYEYVHKQSHKVAAPEFLRTLTHPPPSPPRTRSPRLVVVSQDSEESESDGFDDQSAESDCDSEADEFKTGDELAETKEEDIPADSTKGPVVYQSPVELYLFHPESEAFVSQCEQCVIALTQDATFSYWLWVHDAHRDFVTQPVSSNMNAAINLETCSFIWCYYDEQNFVYTWSVRFPNVATLHEFNKHFTQSLYESSNQEAFSKVPESKLLDPFQSESESEDETSQDEATEEETTSEEESETDEDDDDVYDDDSHHRNPRPPKRTGKLQHHRDSALGPRTKTKNSLLAVGYKHDRSFVVRGNKIGVFRHTDDDGLEFDTTIAGLESTTGRTLDPSKVLLHEEDSSLIIMDKSDPSHLYRMDLERGRVVEDWHVHDLVPTTGIAPSAKFSQMTGEQTLVGLSGNSLFRIDPRLAGTKLVDTEHKEYFTKNRFRCVATTAAGNLAVGSDKGDIRLITKLGQNAKTLLPAMGDPILGIDVTADGRFVVATCQTYLLLIDTVITRNDAKGGDASTASSIPLTTGFQRSIPVQDRRPPVKLQLDPKHVAYMGTAVSFTPAHFDTTSTNNKERRIVSSTGPYVITWNFWRVLQGRPYGYQIKKYTDDVVADNFRYGRSKAVVVALPQDVTMVTKKQLGTPQKVLQTPTKALRSQSSVVYSPY